VAAGNQTLIAPTWSLAAIGFQVWLSSNSDLTSFAVSTSPSLNLAKSQLFINNDYHYQ
jgi:hypothetical protein